MNWKCGGDELENKIVIIAEVMTGVSDVGPVPSDPLFPLSGIHSNAINTILSGNFIHELSDQTLLLIEALLLLAIFFFAHRFSAFIFIIGTFSIGFLYLTIAISLFFYWNLIINIIQPMFILTLTTLSIFTYRYTKEEKEREFVRSTFGRYLSKEVARELLDSPDGLKMKGEIKEVTFLVSDLRGFTALSEQLSPMEVINILNDYLECMVDVITRYNGTVNEIEGDGILIFFGAPISQQDDSLRAVACAIEMQNVLLSLNDKQREYKLPELGMGIGIHCGEVVVGNIGSRKRAKYSAIGSPINTTYRIESYTKSGQVLISSAIYQKLQSQLQLRGSIEVQFKGLTEPSTLYDIDSLSGEYSLKLPEKKDETMLDLTFDLKLDCFTIDGKIISDKPIRGQVKQLGSVNALFIINESLTEYSNIKIHFLSPDSDTLSPCYAKVISVKELIEPHADANSSEYAIMVQFTWLANDVKQFFHDKLAI